MRIIFLNSWYAIVGKSFFDFIIRNASIADFFGLTEIQPELFSKLENLLPKFQGFYEKGIFDPSYEFTYGQAVFIRKEISFKNLGRINSPKDKPDELGFAFALPFEIKIGNKSFYLMNVHGKSRPGDKLDTTARIKQSERILEFLKTKSGPKIIGGDFNLFPETKSISLFSKSGYKDLIKEFSIKSTRNKLCWDQFPDEVKRFGKQYFADYCFVSPEVKVKNFEVLNVEISDHLPLILDFEI